MQIGSDVYCDTALIADVLERIQPPRRSILSARGQRSHLRSVGGSALVRRGRGLRHAARRIQ
jgi:hypothetical protein